VSTQDAFDLQRFVEAQAPVYDGVLAELRAGHKTSHWMWFVFPQLAALGRSSTAKFYGIANLAEARAYAAQPVLGPRLRECCAVLLSLHGPSAHDIFGGIDEVKLKSCLTLFERACPGELVFGACLDRYFAGQRDALTVSLLP
jgi:uncharacterized protein (DUF1810 family)